MMREWFSPSFVAGVSFLVLFLALLEVFLQDYHTFCLKTTHVSCLVGIPVQILHSCFDLSIFFVVASLDIDMTKL